MKNLNLSTVVERQGRVPAGGYILKIVDVQDMPKREYLQVDLDIAEGEHAGYYQELFNSRGFWGLTWYMSYKNRVLGFFKHGINCLRECNPDFVWEDDAENDETAMRGCIVGGVLGEEEFLGNDGTIKNAVKFKRAYTVADIEEGNYDVPEPVKYEPLNMSNDVVDTTVPDGWEAVSDEDIPV